ncbi:MAG: hypothetical protein ABI351_08360 [Herbaspirillum sp.]
MSVTPERPLQQQIDSHQNTIPRQLADSSQSQAKVVSSYASPNRTTVARL